MIKGFKSSITLPKLRIKMIERFEIKCFQNLDEELGKIDIYRSKQFLSQECISQVVPSFADIDK